MTYKPRHERKRAKGGKAETEPLHPEHGNQYNAQGSPEAHEEDAKSDGFKRGGRMKKKVGGQVEGHAARKHLGRRARGGMEARRDEIPERARGGHVAHEKPMARGGSPFSSAQKTSPPGNDHDGPGEQAAMIP